MDSPDHSLTLRVVRHDGQPVAPGLHKVFGERGGTIGRAAQNDWALPDPTRYLSAHHATVYFEQGCFHLVDCSSNGVFVNREEHPLGIERIAKLNHGDQLVLGNYELAVELTRDAAIDASTRDPLRMLARTDASTNGATPAETKSTTGRAADEMSWSDLAAPRCATNVGVDDDVVDPLELLGAPAMPRPFAPAAQRDDAPLLASSFKPPISAVPDDWLEPLERPRQAATLNSATQALENASVALRQALAALESLRLVVCDVRACPLTPTEAAHGLE
jgi:type VI secretion system FHA domain protein